MSIADGTALEVLITGVFDHRRFLDLLANSISFSAENGGAIDTKKVAKAHQYFAVNKAVDATVRAVGQVDGREQLRDQLAFRATGGIVFTTLQKFGRTREERDAGKDHPALSRRRNVIVLADEAHRSHYDFLDGFARNLRDTLPRAALIAFTGTPISDSERNTR